ncbi:MAG: hypothetical protein KDA73_12230 [Rhodobacteraceae bacterium]|nr:hypothetical protein [Paracoccaceae bacterium]
MSQSGLSSLIGNARTLLPERLEDGSMPFVCSCWATDPPGIDDLIALFGDRYDTSESELRKLDWFCPGRRPRKTGTPWPLDSEVPWGAQKDGESASDYRIRRAEWAAAQPDRGYCDE